MFPAAERANRNRRGSALECSRSSPSIPSGSKNAVPASSNEIPCLTSLAAAFLGSHSNTIYVYTKHAILARSRDRRRHDRPLGQEQVSEVFLLRFIFGIACSSGTGGASDMTS